MEQVHFVTPVRRWAETLRPDAWLTQPLGVFFAFSAFIVYSTWAAFQGEHYHFGPYLSPFYSPEIFGDSPHSLLGPRPGWWPSPVPFSPAFLILWAPVGFRLTCYYYRGAYYKAFWHDPPSCSVGEPRSSYWGENSFPLIVQNLHRYFLIFALALLVFLSLDVWNALWFEDPATGAVSFGIGVGTLVLAIERRSARRLHAGVPLVAASRRGRVQDRIAGSAHPPSDLRLRELPEQPAHALRLDEPGLGRLLRHLRAAVRDGLRDGSPAPVGACAGERRGVLSGLGWAGSAALQGAAVRARVRPPRGGSSLPEGGGRGRPRGTAE